ncbi:MAG: pilin [Gammaproteobacteria bacterium]|nr:pilin [Gammaproteobacteria bacterium]
MTEDSNRNRGDDPDSIYRAPSSNTNLAPEGDPFRTFIGPNSTDYYARLFDRFQSGGSSVSWNWPAFFVSSYWLLYRKMWLNAFLYWIALPTGLIVLSGIVAAVMDAGWAILFYYGAYFIIGFVLVPMYANRLYYAHAKSRVTSVTRTTTSEAEQSARLAKIGGTSNVVLFVILPLVIIAVIGILAAIAIPAYQDFTVRAQVAEGLNLSNPAKTAVTEYYGNNGELPVDNASAGLPPASQISGNYVSSVLIDDGDVVVTYGNNAHSIIADETLILTPYPETGGYIEWECYSPTIRSRHLPAVCR